MQNNLLFFVIFCAISHWQCVMGVENNQLRGDFLLGLSIKIRKKQVASESEKNKVLVKILKNPEKGQIKNICEEHGISYAVMSNFVRKKGKKGGISRMLKELAEKDCSETDQAAVDEKEKDTKGQPIRKDYNKNVTYEDFKEFREQKENQNKLIGSCAKALKISFNVAKRFQRLFDTETNNQANIEPSQD